MSNTTYDASCVYLTIYTGNKLPPFYIGSTSIERIRKGYMGSVRSKKYKDIWKSEIRNHPELFKVKIISIHDKREDALLKEEKLHLLLQVSKSPMYINESIASHKGIFGVSLFGNNNPSTKKENREKISSAKKEYWKSEDNRKRMSEKRKKWFDNPENRKKQSEITKIQMRDPKARKLISESKKGLKNPVHRKVADGTHNWLGKNNPVHQRVANGTNNTSAQHICPNCKQSGTGPGMMRWHFDRCRNKKRES